MGVIHLFDGTPGFKSLTNDEGLSGETCNVGSCDDPATSTAVAPPLTACCWSVGITSNIFIMMMLIKFKLIIS